MAQGNTEGFYKPLSAREQWLADQIIEIAITIHKAIGSGLLESVYEECFCYELLKRQIPFKRQQLLPIKYDNKLIVENALRIDIFIDDLVIIDLKAQDQWHAIWTAQVLSYLKLTNTRLGYILNFHVPVMKDGIRRLIK